ncbi:putative transposable element [Trichonephila clavipes]|nr:putative transposable element [Trichonephila clavipes]
MPSPIQSNCDAHDTIANGQYGAVWSMGNTQQDDISVFCRRRTSNTLSPCRLLHIPVVLNDLHSRETTLAKLRVISSVHVVVVSSPPEARNPKEGPFDLSSKLCHKPDPAHETTFPGICPSCSEDEQENQGESSCQVIYSQFGLAIHQNDHPARRRFVEWAQNEIAVVPDFHKRIRFSDEAHFWLIGYVNKQNCRICSEANPQAYIETPLHSEKLTGALYGLVESLDRTSSKTMKATTLQSMELWFQQDGETCHTARATIDLLKDTFGDGLNSRFGPVNWPPRSCNLTPLDYFLWGYVKSLVYADKPQTLYPDNIRRVIADIRPQMLEKVIGNWTSRLDYIQASRGSHMPEIIFNM